MGEPVNLQMAKPEVSNIQRAEARAFARWPLASVATFKKSDKEGGNGLETQAAHRLLCCNE